MKLSKESKDYLASVYREVLFNHELLVNAAAIRGITIRQAYEGVCAELEALDSE